jgi:hypothetical protein
MALSGNLSDMGINDVLQLPFMGARTGELRLTRNSQTARVFYDEGQVVHCVFGSKRDEDALIEILGWSEGDFTFTQGVSPPEKTIKEELPRLLMKVAKRRDEQQKKTAPVSRKLSLESEEVRKTLHEAMAANTGMVWVAFVGRDGRCLNAVPPESPAQAAGTELAKQCFALADAPPQRGVKRCWVEYDDGHSLWLRVGSEVSLIMMAPPSVSMGAVMLVASKVGSTLKQLIEGHDDR